MRKILMTVALLAGAITPVGLQAQEAAKATGPDTVVLPAKRGDVLFTHGKHSSMTECVSCHHASRPEKPLESEHQKCTSCHTNPATEPVKTSGRNSMHDTVNKSGICYDCHVKEAAAGKTVPAKCADCHKQDG